MAQAVLTVTPEEKKEFFNGGSKKLINIIDDLEKSDQIEAELKELKNNKKKLDKELEDTKKSFEKELKDTVNQKRNEEVSEETKKIKDANSNLKSERFKRDRAKSKEVKERIAVETEELANDNKSLHRQIRKTLKENDLPIFCDTTWFYTMYYPQGIFEWLTKIIVMFLVFIVVPCAVVKIVNPWFFLKIILWVFVFIIVFAIYITIYLMTKDKDVGTIEEMREFRDKIAENNKKIKKIKKGIKNDKDESQYKLEDFDQKIADLQGIVDLYTKQRDEKLAAFDENIKPEIEASITQEYDKKIGEISENINCIEKELSDKSDNFEKLNQKITYDYERFLTKQYTNLTSVRKMLEYVEGGNASNILEAYEKIK